MRYYLGIDGGGTKTTALLCDETLRPLASFVGREINYQAVGMETARLHLKETLDGLFLQTGPLPLRAAFIGLSALSDRAPEALTEAFCEGIVKCDTVAMDSDVMIGLEAMETEGAAAFAVCGTGSMVAGRLPDGTLLHTGGWGWLLGDEGSGYRMAVDALRAAVSGYEGSAEATMLTKAAFEYYKLSAMEDLIGLFYDPTPERSEIASFCPVLFACAGSGDAAAMRIIDRQASLFANTVSALLRRLPEGAPLGLWGGVFQHAPLFRGRFAKYVAARFPGSAVSLLPKPPEYGAVLAAMKEDGKNGGKAYG